ncbi:hypothetical protein [Caulobacter sp.]|uniref:hypothetical protein n=1 Tax=Caulobacter sp. TaxID=78 RepID=UPI0031D4C21F
MSLASVADRVRLSSTVSNLRDPAFELLRRNETINPSDQVRALLLTAVVVCQGCGLDPHEEVARTLRMLRQAEGPFTYHVQAIRDYAAGELTRKQPQQ